MSNILGYIAAFDIVLPCIQGKGMGIAGSALIELKYGTYFSMPAGY